MESIAGPQPPDDRYFLLIQRLETAEKENRKLKLICMSVCLVAIGLVTMGQARQEAPKIIQAERFVLKDSAGKEVATLGMTDNGPALDLKWASSAKDQSLGAPALFETKLSAVFMNMSGRAVSGNPSASLWLGRGWINFLADEETRLGISSAPRISVTDEQGFQTIIGRTDLETVKTGESHKTSAASIAIFDKDGKQIWKAPIP